MTNEELIKALKDAGLYIDYVAPRCYASIEAVKAIRAAADALEAAEKRIARLEDALKGKTMRIIDADAYAAELWKLRENYQMLDDTHTADKIMHGIFRAEQALKEQPTVDAMPVVASEIKLCPINHGLRCKDIDNCAFWCEWGQCAVKAIAVACADGERRTDEQQ